MAQRARTCLGSAVNDADDPILRNDECKQIGVN